MRLLHLPASQQAMESRDLYGAQRGRSRTAFHETSLFAPATRAEQSGLSSIANRVPAASSAPHPVCTTLQCVLAIPPMWTGFRDGRMPSAPVLGQPCTDPRPLTPSCSVLQNSGQLTGLPNGLCHVLRGLILEGMSTVQLPLPSCTAESISGHRYV